MSLAHLAREGCLSVAPLGPSYSSAGQMVLPNSTSVKMALMMSALTPLKACSASFQLNSCIHSLTGDFACLLIAAPVSAEPWAAAIMHQQLARNAKGMKLQGQWACSCSPGIRQAGKQASHKGQDFLSPQYLHRSNQPPVSQAAARIANHQLGKQAKQPAS